MFDDVAEFGSAIRGIDVDDDRADPRGRVLHDEPLDALGAPQADAVLRTAAEGDQRRLARRGLALLEGQRAALPHADDRRLPRMKGTAASASTRTMPVLRSATAVSPIAIDEPSLAIRSPLHAGLWGPCSMPDDVAPSAVPERRAQLDRRVVPRAMAVDRRAQDAIVPVEPACRPASIRALWHSRRQFNPANAWLRRSVLDTRGPF